MADGLLSADQLRALCGKVIDIGRYELTEEDIRSFGQQWDPLPMHIGDGAHYGRLIASGVHTFAIFHRLAVLSAYSRWAIVAGRGVRTMDLPRPAFVGDTLSGQLIIRSIGVNNRGRARVTLDGRLLNQRQQPVLTANTICYVHT